VAVRHPRRDPLRERGKRSRRAMLRTGGRGTSSSRCPSRTSVASRPTRYAFLWAHNRRSFRKHSICDLPRLFRALPVPVPLRRASDTDRPEETVGPLAGLLVRLLDVRLDSADDLNASSLDVDRLSPVRDQSRADVGQLSPWVRPLEDDRGTSSDDRDRSSPDRGKSSQNVEHSFADRGKSSPDGKQSSPDVESSFPCRRQSSDDRDE
jgi:hypothetical protein